MADLAPSSIWLRRAVFVLLALGIIFAQLLPLDIRPTRWPAPDLLLAVTLAWVVRRPDYAPVIIIAGIFLLTDFLFQRPPGLWAGLVVVLSEMLRARAGRLRNTPLALEWGSVAMGIVAITLANRVVLAAVLTDQVPIGLTLIQMLMTIVTYPLVMVIAQFGFGISRVTGHAETMGHRI